MSYVCPHCGTLDINLEVPIQNVVNYRGVSRVAAPCCKKPIRISATNVAHVQLALNWTQQSYKAYIRRR